MTINEITGGAIGHLGVTLTWGLIVLAMIYALGDISGAHINPAVTLAFAVADRFAWRDVVPYIVAQCLGAVLAAGLLRVMFPTSETLGASLPATIDDIPYVWQSAVLEIFLTWMLMLVILRVSTGAKEKGITAGIAIGAVIALEATFAGPICMASMNPARSLGPALLSGHVEYLWMYLAMPTLGALLAVPTCQLLAASKPCGPSA